MKVQTWILTIGSTITIIGCFITIFFAPYYVNDTELYMTIADTDRRIVALFILLVLLVVWTIAFFFVVPNMKDDIWEYPLPNYLVRIIPLFPIISIIVSVLFPSLWGITTNTNYAVLGMDFVKANIFEFTSILEYSDLVDIGQSLSFGIGYYLLWILIGGLVMEYILYYRLVSKVMGRPIT